jgi:hypothetical protein
MTIETAIAIALLAVTAGPAGAAIIDGYREAARDRTSMRRHARAREALDR